VFASRREAGLRLADWLAPLGDQQPLVIALPRGGLPVAAEIAARLNADLDLLLVRKIGAPQQPELALGALVEGNPPVFSWNEKVIARLRVRQAEIDAIVKAQSAEIERRRKTYLGAQQRVSPDGRLVILVDDGIATGATVRAALRALRKQGARRILLAVPLAPSDVVKALQSEADDVYCLDSPDPFGSVGAHYRDFHQLDDAEAIAILDAAGRSKARDNHGQS
jgi:putative phosphoribosyl transferase